MSLQRYLFLLISTLIVLLIASQVLLLNYLQSNYQQQVNTQAKKLSKQVIEFASERFQDTNFVIRLNNGTLTPYQAPVIKLDISADESRKFIELRERVLAQQTTQLSENEVVIHTGNSNALNFAIGTSQTDTAIKRIDVSEHQDSNQRSQPTSPTKSVYTGAPLSQQNHQYVTQIDTDKANNYFYVKQFSQVVAQLHQQVDDPLQPQNATFETSFVTSVDNDDNGVSHLVSNIIYMLILSAVVAISFAYWVSDKFNRPLKALATGFENVANGNYQHQVTPQGVAEIRKAMNQFNDMVHRVDALSKAQVKQEQIQQIAELNEVSKGLAHALRNPIHTIGLSLEQLHINDSGSANDKQMLLNIKQKIAHINNTISAMLRLTTTGMSREQQVPIKAVVQDIIMEYKSFDEKALTFTVDIDNQLHLQGNESEIRSIIHTVLINACEASGKNNVIDIKAEVKDDDLSVWVQDHGTGISDHILANLFTPHCTNKPEGAGMGLYIAKRAIGINYGGNITLSNNAKGCLAHLQFINTTTEHK
ncbi:ATP-binding protein [Thalassotalea maritima]|uniref:ATP-binding protein n=1 Tax=Thalassotalea maritima TaxID=3242416 RepID=UPI003526ECF2